MDIDFTAKLKVTKIRSVATITNGIIKPIPIVC